MLLYFFTVTNQASQTLLVLLLQIPADEELTARFDDVMFVPEQSAFLRQNMGRRRRQKRKVYRFENFPNYKWNAVGSNPVVYYKFDGTHCKQTCVYVFFFNYIDSMMCVCACVCVCVLFQPGKTKLA